MQDKQLSVSIVSTIYSKNRVKLMINSFTRLLKEIIDYYDTYSYFLKFIEILIVVENDYNLFRYLVSHFRALLRKELNNNLPTQYISMNFFFVDKGFGLSNARNLGILKSKGEVIIFIDDDAIVSKFWLLELVKPYFLKKEIYCVGGFSLPTFLKRSSIDVFKDSIFSWLFGSHPTYLNKTQRIFSVLGSNMSFRRIVFNKVGFFNPLLGFSKYMHYIVGSLIGGEETELCLRINLMLEGSIILHNPKAKIYHIVDNRKLSLCNIFKRTFYFGVTNQLIRQFITFYMKNKKKKLTMFDKYYIWNLSKFFLMLLFSRPYFSNKKRKSLFIITKYFERIIAFLSILLLMMLGVVFSIKYKIVLKYILKKIDMNDLYFKLPQKIVRQKLKEEITLL